MLASLRSVWLLWLLWGVMALPSTPILDDFNRADEGPPPSASWSSADVSVVSNRIVPTIDEDGNAVGSAIWIDPFTSSNQEAYFSLYVDQGLAEVSNITNVSLFLIYLRNIPEVSQYSLLLNVMPPLFTDPGTVSIFLGRSGNNLAGVTNLVYTSGDSFALSVAGNVLTGYHRPAGGAWTAVVSATDDELTDIGQTEIVFNAYNGTALTSIWSIDDFGGGDHDPTILTATAAGATQIDLAWNDVASDETGFEIERSLDGVNFAVIDTTAANVTTRTNTGLAEHTLYYYRVRAFNGDGYYDYSNIASATTMAPPTAPTLLTATAMSASRIDLAWTDNATNENGYKIERGLDGINFTQIAIVGPNTSAYIDQGLLSNTLYYYRVRAYNGDGDSAYSNIASATTLTRCEGGFSYFDVLLRAARLLEYLHEGTATADGSTSTLIDTHLGAFIGSGDDDFNGGSFFWKTHKLSRIVGEVIATLTTGAISASASIPLPPIIPSSVDLTVSDPVSSIAVTDDGAGVFETPLLTTTEAVNFSSTADSASFDATYYRIIPGTFVLEYGVSTDSDYETATDDGGGSIDIFIPLKSAIIGTVSQERTFSGFYPPSGLPATPGTVTLVVPYILSTIELLDDGVGGFSSSPIVLTGEDVNWNEYAFADKARAPLLHGIATIGNITPGTVTITWDDGGTPQSDTDDGSGNITVYVGGSAPANHLATIDYLNGTVEILNLTSEQIAWLNAHWLEYTHDSTYREYSGTINYTTGEIALFFSIIQTGTIEVKDMVIAAHTTAVTIDYTTGLLTLTGLIFSDAYYLESATRYRATYQHRRLTGTVDYVTGAVQLLFDRLTTGAITVNYTSGTNNVFLPVIMRVTDFTEATGTVTFEPSTLFELNTGQGDGYGLASRRYPYYLLIQKLNEALNEIKHYVLDQADIVVAEAGTLSVTNTNEIDLPDTVRIFKIWNGNTEQDPQDWQLVSRYLHQNGKVRFYDYLPWTTLRISYFADIPEVESETDCLPRQIDATWLAYEVAVKCCRWRLFQPGADEKSLTTQINDLMARATRARARMNLYQPQQAAMKLPIIPDR